jgi:5'-phosphate synthase pdxT subunit
VNGIQGDFPGVFIRAPVVERVGDAVEVLATHDEHPVLVRQGAIWAATFHPELSGDLRLHQRFLTEGTAAAALPTGAAEPELATAPKEKT